MERVLEAMQRRRRRQKFGQTARDMGLIDEEHILAALAVQMNLFPGVGASAWARSFNSCKPPSRGPDAPTRRRISVPINNPNRTRASFSAPGRGRAAVGRRPHGRCRRGRRRVPDGAAAAQLAEHLHAAVQAEPNSNEPWRQSRRCSAVPVSSPSGRGRPQRLLIQLLQRGRRIGIDRRQAGRDRRRRRVVAGQVHLVDERVGGGLLRVKGVGLGGEVGGLAMTAGVHRLVTRLQQLSCSPPDGSAPWRSSSSSESFNAAQRRQQVHDLFLHVGGCA